MDWIENYLTGIDEIDMQHRELFKVAKNYRDTLSQSKKEAVEETAKVLNYLVEYTKFHFDFEEKYLSSINYPKLNDHIDHHKTLISKLEQIISKEESEKNNDPNFIYVFLVTWLKKHIASEDQFYVKFKNQL